MPSKNMTSITQSFVWCGQLRHIFDYHNLALNIKLRLYQAAVCSILTYGCETWWLTPQVRRQLNGANNKILSRFTGKSIPQEARSNTCSYKQCGTDNSATQTQMTWTYPEGWSDGSRLPCHWKVEENWLTGKYSNGYTLALLSEWSSVSHRADHTFWRSVSKKLQLSIKPGLNRLKTGG